MATFKRRIEIGEERYVATRADGAKSEPITEPNMETAVAEASFENAVEAVAGDDLGKQITEVEDIDTGETQAISA